MKASHVHAALATVMATCMISTGLAFLPPPTAFAGGAPPTAAARNARNCQGAVLGAPVERLASRLTAAREDCKSCMEAELLEEERKRAGMEGEDGGKRVAARRAALEEVGTFGHILKPADVVTQNQPPTRDQLLSHVVVMLRRWCWLCCAAGSRCEALSALVCTER